ncbi:DUF4235 domain-containing protein [Sciscionella marina]|uniref:DUF4235 domain-containing protein n=1 Tax=Sciscionella marina TaxID=508770 RepID=UPI0003644463|nr:DUF4235 domain-containing protein [Sciscionella marina]
MNHSAARHPTSTSAKILYRPVGMAGSILGGLLANVIFKKIWQQAAPGQRPDPPGALATGPSFTTILLAAALQGTIFSVVKTLIDRGGARVFTRWSGEWPGD